MIIIKHIILVFTVFIAGTSCWLIDPDPDCPFPSEDHTYLIDPSNCASYYECYEGTKTHKECPPNFMWNAVLSYCDFPENVDCSRLDTTTPGTGITTTPIHSTTPSGVDPMCPYPSDDITYFPFPGNCSMYIECYEGTRYNMSCPPNLFWNQYVENCDYVCNGTGTTPSDIDPGCSATGISYLPNYADCTLFYECVNGRKQSMSCPSGFAWSIETNSCGRAEQVDCSYTTVSPPKTTTPAPGPDNQCPATGLSYLPNYADCTKYYRCYNGQKTAENCPDGYAWNIIISACDKKDQVDCSFTTVNPPATTTKKPDSGCPATGVSYLPNYGDCTKFYQCNNGVKTSMNCPNGYAWNINANECEIQSSVDCSYTTGSPDVTTSQPLPDDTCIGQADGTLLPYPKNCRKFIECAFQKAVIFDCAKDTSWNDAIKRCDENNDANCKTNLIFNWFW